MRLKQTNTVQMTKKISLRFSAWGENKGFFIFPTLFIDRKTPIDTDLLSTKIVFGWFKFRVMADLQKQIFPRLAIDWKESGLEQFLAEYSKKTGRKITRDIAEPIFFAKPELMEFLRYTEVRYHYVKKILQSILDEGLKVADEKTAQYKKNSEQRKEKLKNQFKQDKQEQS